MNVIKYFYGSILIVQEYLFAVLELNCTQKF